MVISILLFNDKRDDFNFRIVNFPYMSSNIPADHHMAFTFLNWFELEEFVTLMTNS